MPLCPDCMNISYDEDRWCLHCQKTIKKQTSTQARHERKKTGERILFIQLVVAQLAILAAILLGWW